MLGEVLLTTATENDHISALAEKYGLPLIVRQGQPDIAQDWNFGYAQAHTPLVTIAHQDDWYEPEYLSKALELLNRSKHPLIFFTDYCELRGESRVQNNSLLRVKRFLLTPLRVKRFQTSKLVRRRVLSMGCPICCPSVTYVTPHLPKVVFQSGYHSDLDWQAWEALSKRDGSFVYCPQPLMMHRVHADSATTAAIGENARSREDYEMFCKFWPRPIAKALTRIYVKSQRSNQI